MSGNILEDVGFFVTLARFSLTNQGKSFLGNMRRYIVVKKKLRVFSIHAGIHSLWGLNYQF